MKPDQCAQWDEAKLEITRQMRLVMMPFITPLVRAEDDGGAEHIGSGGYVEYADRKLLLTNDHVVREGLGRLTHNQEKQSQRLNRWRPSHPQNALLHCTSSILISERYEPVLNGNLSVM